MIELDSYQKTDRLQSVATGDQIAKELRRAVMSAVKAGRSYSEIARKAGIPFPTLHRIADDPKAGMNVDTAAALASALGMRLELKLRRKGR